jgi:hypothetical protein
MYTGNATISTPMISTRCESAVRSGFLSTI